MLFALCAYLLRVGVAKCVVVKMKYLKIACVTCEDCLVLWRVRRASRLWL